MTITNDLIRQLDEKLDSSVPDNRDLFHQVHGNLDHDPAKRQQLNLLHKYCYGFSGLIKTLRHKIDSVQSVNPAQSGVLIESGDVHRETRE